MYSRVKEVVKTMLSTVKWMSLTSDVWTCKETRYSFISLTAHWIGDNFERKSAALSIKVFPGRHTGEAVSEKLTELLSFWDIDKIKVHLLMRDNGGNMKKGYRLCDIASESCTIHTLQLVIKGAIKSDKGVRILLKKCRKIATHIHKSSPSSSALAQIQVDLNIPIKKELENCLDLFAETQEDNTNSKGLECAECELLEELINLLKPFEEVTKSLSSNDSCISEVIPTIKALKFCLSKRKVSSTLISFKASLEADLETRFKDIFGSTFQSSSFINSFLRRH
ncbi:zinc finger BED domain-containing protein 4-like [Belonocnema kinseyi]|uniref:zinc finger BED domain-containing protein 4-like n=1 Tax=Belonocnema kinseyi TaxID=2817044 RepID=UPI00143CDC66|nr:zinc finger BED domain-containing protein 4-like [Belonocnema kinseyi]